MGNDNVASGMAGSGPRQPSPQGPSAEQQRMWRLMLHLPRVFELAQTTEVGASPKDVVLERRGFRLLRYRRTTPAVYAEPILFCYALINRPYILDLLPDKSIVKQYLAQGFEVYMIDWAIPTDADRLLTLEDYVCEFLEQAVAFVLQEHRREDVHLLGYCMGGTLSVLYTAIRPASIRSLTLLAAPIDFSGQETLLHVWTDRKLFDVDAFVDAHGNCPAWFLQTCFLLMKPIQNLLEKNIALVEQLDDPRLVANHFAMERWLNDNVPVAGETFREFVKNFFQSNELIRGEFRMGRRQVDLSRIAVPLLLLTATNDNLVAPSSTEGIRPHVRSRDIRSMSIEAGHVGLVVGSKAQKTLWPEATRWLAQRSTAAAGKSTATAAGAVADS